MKVIKAKIIAFVKTRILGHILSVKNLPFKNVSPLIIVQCVKRRTGLKVRAGMGLELVAGCQ